MRKGEEKPYPTTIPKWPEAERPREKLIKLGADNLSDAELLAIILRIGGRKRTALDLARYLLKEFGGFRNLDSLTISELKKIKGIGTAKAAQIKATLAIGKRFLKEPKGPQKKIRTADDVVEYCAERLIPYMRDRKQEVFKAILLDGKNKVLKDITVSVGSLTASIVHPREVLKEAIAESAASMILVHNHPSGETEPSEEDINLTERLISASDMVGIRVLDHIILGENTYFSFLKKGLIKERG